MDNILVFFGKVVISLITSFITLFRNLINVLFSIADKISLYFIRHVNKMDKKVKDNIVAYQEYVDWYKVAGPQKVDAKRHQLGKYASKVAELRNTNRK